MRLDLNFATREYLLLRRIYYALGGGLAACAAVLSVLAVTHAGSVERVEGLKAEVEARERSLAASEKRLAEYARSVDKAAIASAYVEADFANSAIRRRVFSWTLFLNRIEVIVPDGVGITGIRPDFKSLYVDISGTAKDMDALTGFIQRLTASEYFEDLPPAFTTSEVSLSKDIGKSVQQFSIKIRYFPDPAVKPPDEDGGEEG